MNINPSAFTVVNPTELILEIPPDTQHLTWQQGHFFTHPGSYYQAYLNQLCLTAVLPWLQEEWEQGAKPWPNHTSLPSFWEFVNGTAITVGETRFVLVPSEAIDSSELRVAQEWVDIPNWLADYYLAVQVEPDDGYVRVWGYCTHAQLKTKGSYDGRDRTYSMDADDMIADMSILGVARQLCPQEPTRSIVQFLPTLKQQQAQNLISRLGDPTIIAPRLEIPFLLWGSLIEHGGWRQSLYQKRLGIAGQWSVLQWIECGVSQMAKAVGWENFHLQLSIANARSVEGVRSGSFLARQLLIAGQLYELRITPQTTTEVTIWRFELRNTIPGATIPGGFKLKLLTEDLQPFPNNEDIAITAVEQLFVEVALDSGEGIVWEIEPFPENYDQEILRF